MESIKPLIRNTLVYTYVGMWENLSKLPISLHHYFRISFTRASGKRREEASGTDGKEIGGKERQSEPVQCGERVQTETEEQEKTLSIIIFKRQIYQPTANPNSIKHTTYHKREPLST